ncbi:GAP family protein [Thermoactinospora rubra]|uniref:GAP family protein n=1 Tax=Thermoactinospora rubra TaxID=1088767 RepID=UPI000A11E75F|nr:GAP family protein [Thermoactinospora rubra]
MTIGLVVTLVALALVDSTSFGTLGVPVVLMLSGATAKRLLVYLATISAFYFAVGAALMLGLGALLERFGDALASRTASWVQLAIGVGLFALSWRFDSKKRGYRPLWEPRLGGPRVMALVALTAGLVEVATMVPYLAAVGIMTKAELPVAQWAVLLAGYVVVMVVPALALLAARTVASRWLDPKLERLRAWLLKHSASAVGWALGIVGVLLALDALSALQR